MSYRYPQITRIAFSVLAATGIALAIPPFARCSHTRPLVRENSADRVKPAQAKTARRLVLLGDGGLASANEPIWKKLPERLDKNSVVIFLGDNIYENGLPAAADAPDRDLYAERLNTQLTAAKNAGKTLFVPGNHDWNHGRRDGAARVRAQAAVLRAGGALHPPSPGCPVMALEELAPGWTLLYFDSEAVFLLGDTESETGHLPADCAARTRSEFLRQSAQLLKDRLPDKTRLIVAAHHPLASHGTHGGFYDWPHHIFPVQNYNKYIPLPGIASLVVWGRQLGWASTTDLANSRYRRYSEFMRTLLRDRQVALFAAGHDHNLQLLRGDENIKWHLVSGSASKVDTAGAGDDTIMAWERQGFFIVDILDNGKLRIAMYAGEEDLPQGEIILAP